MCECNVTKLIGKQIKYFVSVILSGLLNRLTTTYTRNRPKKWNQTMAKHSAKNRLRTYCTSLGCTDTVCIIIVCIVKCKLYATCKYWASIGHKRPALIWRFSYRNNSKFFLVRVPYDAANRWRRDWYFGAHKGTFRVSEVSVLFIVRVQVNRNYFLILYKDNIDRVPQCE